MRTTSVKPIGMTEYYHNAMSYYKKGIEDITQEIKDTYAKNVEYRKFIDETWKVSKINPNQFPEYVKDEYIDGSLVVNCRRIYLNKTDYPDADPLFIIKLIQYGKNLKKVIDLDKQRDLYRRIVKLNSKEYRNIIKAFYTQVHKELIINGYGYSFYGHVGWICYNRVALAHCRHIVDYMKTRKRKAQLLAEGKKIYNKEEAKWCEERGIPYEAEDARVFRTEEYFYELCILGNNRIARKNKIIPTDYRDPKYRNKTNEEVLAECNNDLNTICELSVDIKTKMTLALKADKTLYTKFIRNEKDNSCTYSKISVKNR